METPHLVLLPWMEARRALGARAIALKIVRPPYPVAGAGELRVLRVRETGDALLDIACGYERYDRL